MKQIPPFSASSLESISKILGDTDNGLTGSKIGQILTECSIADTHPTHTKWQRLYNALTNHQNEKQYGNHVVAFINKVIDPVKHTSKPEIFRKYREQLIPILSFSALGINENGKINWVKKAESLDDALSRANRIKAELERRKAHAEVMLYCREELMRESSFHAVLEALKGIASRMRALSGFGEDGAELVTKMFSLGKDDNPEFAINDLKDDSMKSEQKGFVNLLIGMFGMFRNTTAHAARISWLMPETDALDILTAVSLVHRKLDKAYKYKK